VPSNTQRRICGKHARARRSKDSEPSCSTRALLLLLRLVLLNQCGGS
jgi:hypothetical protein